MTMATPTTVTASMAGEHASNDTKENQMQYVIASNITIRIRIHEMNAVHMRHSPKPKYTQTHTYSFILYRCEHSSSSPVEPRVWSTWYIHLASSLLIILVIVGWLLKWRVTLLGCMSGLCLLLKWGGMGDHSLHWYSILDELSSGTTQTLTTQPHTWNVPECDFM